MGRWRRQTQSSDGRPGLSRCPSIEERLPLLTVERNEGALLVWNHPAKLLQPEVYGPALEGGELVGGALVNVLCHEFSISKSELLVKAGAPAGNQSRTKCKNQGGAAVWAGVRSLLRNDSGASIFAEGEVRTKFRPFSRAGDTSAAARSRTAVLAPAQAVYERNRPVTG